MAKKDVIILPLDSDPAAETGPDDDEPRWP